MSQNPSATRSLKLVLSTISKSLGYLTMANARGKTIDNTHLSLDQAEARGFIHRDYIAHCLRWSHVAKHIGKGYANHRVLDVGAGRDLPLAKLLYSSRLIVEEFVGVDYNHPDKFDLSPFHTGKFPLHAYGSVDFPRDLTFVSCQEADHGWYSLDNGATKHSLPTVITCFEVLEHVEPDHATAMLETFKMFLLEGQAEGLKPSLFISTPCYDEKVGAAANHVSELTRTALGALIEDLGLRIAGNWGTFASMRDYKDKLDSQPGLKPLFDQLRAYYDVNYLATVFAPLFPAQSRNNLWHITADKVLPGQRRFPYLNDAVFPWSSSERWAALGTSKSYWDM